MRSDIAVDRKRDLEFKLIEGINFEVSLNGNKWHASGAYKPPSMSDELFEQDCSFGMGKISEKYEDFILLGDLNFNMLDGPKSEKLKGFCDIFDLSNTVKDLKDPTCFTSRNKPSLLDEPSLLDVILVDQASFIGKTFNFNCVLSDVLNLIVFHLIIDVPSNNP